MPNFLGCSLASTNTASLLIALASLMKIIFGAACVGVLHQHILNMWARMPNFLGCSVASTNTASLLIALTSLMKIFFGSRLCWCSLLAHLEHVGTYV